MLLLGARTCCGRCRPWPILGFVGIPTAASSLSLAECELNLTLSRLRRGDFVAFEPLAWEVRLLRYPVCLPTLRIRAFVVRRVVGTSTLVSRLNALSSFPTTRSFWFIFNDSSGISFSSIPDDSARSGSLPMTPGEDLLVLFLTIRSFWFILQ